MSDRGPAGVSYQSLNQAREELKKQLGRAVVGQDEAIEQILITLFAGGHCMITGMPGVAKTMLITSLAKLMQLSSRRIQFTPDLMPSDITGTEVLEEDRATGRRTLKFVKGPVFSNMVIADEINRTPPKTQASLLEAMQEKQVTLGGKTYPLPQPFFVLATQIPFDQEGTYPLPEAQQDRFMFSVRMGYVSEDDEVAVVKRTTSSHALDLSPVVKGDDMAAYRDLVMKVELPQQTVNQIVDLVAASRPGNPEVPEVVKEYVAWGAGLRAAQNIALGAKSRAAIYGRTTVTGEDVEAVLMPVMRHRLGLSFRAEIDKVKVEDVITKLIQAAYRGKK